MIQRIQSLYLLAVTVISLLMFRFSFMDTIQADGLVYALKFNGFAAVDGSVIAPVYLLAGLIVVSALLAFVSIFFFKKRKLQVRLNLFNMILFLFIYVAVFFYFYMLKGQLRITDYALGISFLFPAVNLFLTFLAIRAIRADEAMVKSLDRLR